jgi:hypothetical protein
MTDDVREGAIVAPWSTETVETLNAYQVAGVMHPFTCALDSGHGAGYLLATKQGWVCTEDGCGYTQDWAHDFMTTKAARTPFWQRAEVPAKADAMQLSAVRGS